MRQRAGEGVARSQRRRFGLVARLMAGHVAILVGIIALVGVAGQRAATARARAMVAANLRAQVREYAQALARRPAGESLARFDAAFVRSDALAAGYALALSVAGSPASTSASVGEGGFLVTQAGPARLLASPPAKATTAWMRVGTTRYMVLVSPVLVGGKVRGAILAAADATALGAFATAFPIGWAEGILALGAAAAAGYVLLRRTLRAVAAVSQVARRIGAEGITTRLSYDGPEDEIGELIATFNEMLDRIDRSFAAQRGLLADVSHQLQTPMTVIRGHLELLGRGASDAGEVSEVASLLMAEVDETSALIERMLELGKSLDPAGLREEVVELEPFLAETLGKAALLAPRRWALGPVPALCVVVDPLKLRSALLNLLRNAADATTEGGSVVLSAALTPGSGPMSGGGASAASGVSAVRIEVSDDGRGMDDSLLDTAFVRFTSASGSKRSSGIGLAIVKAVAESHGGTVDIESSPGRGCSVSILLPGSRVCSPESALPATLRGREAV